MDVVNAFYVKGPVPPEYFFDRRREVEFFVGSLDSGGSDILMAVMGPFKFGKSSLLIKLHDISLSYPDVVPILLRLNIVRRPIAFLLKGLERVVGGSCLNELWGIYRDVSAGREEPYRLFSLIDRSLSKQNKSLLLIVDEFQAMGRKMIDEGFLAGFDDKAAFEFMKGVVETYNVGLVVGGSLIGSLKDALKVWGGRFTVFHLTKFERSDSIEMLSTLFRLSRFRIDEEKIEYIAYVCRDNPYYMQLFGRFLVNSRRQDLEAMEYVREIVQRSMIDYYDTKLIELIELGDEIFDVLQRVAEGVDIRYLDKKQKEIAIALERAGVIYRENSILRYYDENFEQYIINTISERPTEKFLPTYVPEYIIARELAYREKIRDILVSFMSWGPFDILIPLKESRYWGIGIQVKATKEEQPIISKEALQQIEEKARQKNILPILAIYYEHKRKISYHKIKNGELTPRKGLDRLKNLIES